MTRFVSITSTLIVAAALAVAACRRGDDPRAALDRFFGTAVRHDYAATYDCYDAAYRAKVSREDFVRHRADASPLQGYRVVSLEQHGDRARATVALDFGPSAKAGRLAPVSTTVEENLVRERGGWKISVL
ncbi:hypothetical protein [Anaeromyxobacter oryzisoli]|uniref:hypothetical protein n=1 Tax=Anaeromyxobacter oryzisoli TaxID=2925408 RepID=UPI001F5AEEF1|nr:hypothetical protein [Anaeromyxobacter sp. SG63]